MRKGCFCDQPVKRTRRSPHEDEVGGAVLVLHTGVHYACGGHGHDLITIAAHPRADAERAMRAERMIQHVAVALFKNEQGQVAAGEQKTLRQHHDRQLGGQRQRSAGGIVFQVG